MSIGHKLNRYKSLISQFANWPEYLSFKAGSEDSFRFKMKNGFEIEVPRKMLPPFKESFFDGVYLKGLPKEFEMPSKPIIVDIGANVGYFGLYMLSQFSGARVFGFEPMPFNFKQLSKYQKEYSNHDWKNFNQAVADHNNGLTLYSSTLDQFSTMAGVFEADGRGEKIEVSTLTLTEVMEANKLDHIDLLKLDCEGSEYAILYSLSDQQFQNIHNFCIETHPGHSGDQNHDALKAFLKTKGYALNDKMNDDGTGYIWAWIA